MERSGQLGSAADAPEGATDHEAAFRRQRWKDGLLKKADGDPMSLLNALRTHLRVQFATQDQTQRQVSQNIAALASRSQMYARY